MKQTFLNLWQKNGILSIINQMKVMMLKKKIIYDTEVLKSNLYEFNDAYILVRGDVTIIAHQATQVAFKNCYEQQFME